MLKDFKEEMDNLIDSMESFEEKLKDLDSHERHTIKSLMDGSDFEYVWDALKVMRAAKESIKGAEVIDGYAVEVEKYIEEEYSFTFYDSNRCYTENNPLGLLDYVPHVISTKTAKEFTQYWIDYILEDRKERRE